MNKEYRGGKGLFSGKEVRQRKWIALVDNYLFLALKTLKNFLIITQANPKWESEYSLIRSFIH